MIIALVWFHFKTGLHFAELEIILFLILSTYCTCEEITIGHMRDSENFSRGFRRLIEFAGAAGSEAYFFVIL